MTLRARLTLGLLTIAAILIVPLLFAMRSLDQLHGEAQALRDDDFVASLLLGRVRDELNNVRTAEIAVLFVRERESVSRMDRHLAALERLSDSLETYSLGSAARDIRAALGTIGSGVRAEHRAALGGRDREAETISRDQVVPAISSAETAIRVAESTLRDRTRDRVAGAARAAMRGRTIAVTGLLLALLVVAAIAFRLTQSISRPVTELERGMSKVADGDFTARLAISPSRNDEFGRLAVSYEEMTRQLTELDKLKAEFVSVASHELKTPINVVLGYVQLLQEGVYGPLTDKQREVAGVLENQTKTLSRLVTQLLDLARFEAGRGKLEVRAVQLASFLDHLENAFRVLAHQRGVRFNVSVHDDVPDTVHWDEDRINEVLGNLLSNAFKFTPEGGEVELTVLPLDHGVQMEVRDTGAGIPAHQLPLIFEKFYQAANQPSEKTAKTGSGLGLAIAREIVEAHNGSITCDSTPGVGTTFTIVLPERAAGRRTSAKHQMAEV
jgi:signal transduction histidine kinase